MTTLVMNSAVAGKVRNEKKEVSFKTRVKNYFEETIQLVGPGFFMMNGSYYRPYSK